VIIFHYLLFFLFYSSYSSWKVPFKKVLLSSGSDTKPQNNVYTTLSSFQLKKKTTCFSLALLLLSLFLETRYFYFFIFFFLLAEPCDLPCPTSNQILPGGGVGGGGGGSGGRGSSPSVSGVAAPSPSPQSHSSPYDLRRKSPPHPDPAPGTSSALPPSGGSSIAATFGSSSLPARKRPRRTCSLSTDGTFQNCHNWKRWVELKIVPRVER